MNTQSNNIPASLLPRGVLARNIPTIKNNNRNNVVVAEQIDSVHKVVQVLKFLVALRIEANLHAT